MEYSLSNPRGEGSSRATTNSVRRVWSKTEDEDLKRAVLKYEPVSASSPAWAVISTVVGHGDRSTKDCRKRWYYTLDPTLKKGRWTSEEDQLLRDAFSRLGPQWTALASYVPGRNDEQVAKRWKDVLSPELDLSAPWTRDEDEMLLKLHRIHGPKWTLISDAFPKRNGIACRNRHRKWSKLTQDTGQGSEMTASPGGVTSDATSAFDGRDDFLPSEATDSSMPDLPEVTEEEQQAFSQMLQSFITESQAAGHHQTVSDDPAPGIGHLSGFDTSVSQGATHPFMENNFSLESWIQNVTERPYNPQEPFGSDMPSFAANNPAPTIETSRFETTQNRGTEPIENVWALFTALESDPADSLLLSKDLIRKLIADASAK